MSLTVLESPATRSFMGNQIKFRFSSDLSPNPTASTSRSINTAVTANGFLTVGVTTSATELVVGGYLQLVIGTDTFVAKILAVNITTNRELTLNIQNPGIVIGVSSVRLYYFNYAIQLRLKIGQPDVTNQITVTLQTTVFEIDIADTLRKYWERYFMAYDSDGYDLDQVSYVWAVREVYTGSATSFTSDSAELMATPGKLRPQESTQIALTERPIVSDVVSGQVVPASFFPELSGSQIVRHTFSGMNTDTAIEDEIQISGTNSTISSGANTISLRTSAGGLISELFTLNPRCRKSSDVEIVWRNRYGHFDSHVFTLVRSNVQTSKSGFFTSSNQVAAINAGQAGNFNRNYFIVDAETNWQLSSGVVGNVVADWLSFVAQSDEVYYRDGLNYYRVVVGDSNIGTGNIGITYPIVEFVIFGSEANALQRPRFPLEAAIAADLFAIYEAYVAANSFTSDSAGCVETFITDLTQIAI